MTLETFLFEEMSEWIMGFLQAYPIEDHNILRFLFLFLFFLTVLIVCRKEKQQQQQQQHGIERRATIWFYAQDNQMHAK